MTFRHIWRLAARRLSAVACSACILHASARVRAVRGPCAGGDSQSGAVENLDRDVTLHPAIEPTLRRLQGGQ